jgi:cytosine/adenosine deaminase-related metal-dependent hydrolase
MDKILRDGTVVSWDDTVGAVKVLQKASVLITEDRIAQIAEDASELHAAEDAEVIDVTGMILTPGFVSAHSHMWQTSFRSMAPDVFIA